MTHAARATSADVRFYGVVVGTVDAVEDDPFREGRVKLCLPWFDGVMTTDWCRVCQPYAGNGYGMFWVPERGDEVLVAFDHGHLTAPIVLGGLYNGKDKPPSHRGGGRDEKVIRTRAGHRIVFDDAAGTVRVDVESGASVTLSRSSISLRAEQIEIVATKGDVTVSGTTIRLNS